jgi:hypothetical protein
MEKIEVKVQTEERMNAITNLCIAIKEAALALNRPTQVNITECVFNGGDPAVSIDTENEVESTIIYEK